MTVSASKVVLGAACAVLVGAVWTAAHLGPRGSASAEITLSVRPLETRSTAAGPVGARRAALAGAITTSPADATFEVSVPLARRATGAVFVVDEGGRSLGFRHAVERLPTDPTRARALIPLRALPPHPGRTRVACVTGSPACVDAALREAEHARDAFQAARDVAVRCGGAIAEAPLAGVAPEAFDPSQIEDAELTLRSGDPASALAAIDRARPGAVGIEAARADALAAEAAIALGRNVLAGRLAARGLQFEAPPALRARLLRASILSEAEVAKGATPSSAARDALRATSDARAAAVEQLLDAALDLRVALDHDRSAAPPQAPVAARRLADIAASADERALAPAAAMICQAGSSLDAAPESERAALLERGSRAARLFGSVADQAYCEFAASDAAREAGALEDAEWHARQAIDALGDRPLPREQREAWYTGASLSARRGRLAEAFVRAKTAYEWLDRSLALETDMEERVGLLGDTFTYYGEAERFGISAGDIVGAVAASEWGKARAFGSLLRDDGEVVDAAAGTFVLARDEVRDASALLLEFAASLEPTDVALSYAVLGRSGETTGPEVAIGVVTSRGTSARVIPRPKGLCADVRALGAAVASGEEGAARVVGRRLYDALVLPVAADLAGARRVFISPHLCLEALPWAALFDGRGYLVERSAIARMPPLVAARRTASDERALVGGGASDERGWLLAYDAAHPGSAPLPGLASLATEIAARVHPASELVGDALTPERFLDGVTRVDSVFYAGHAEYASARPLRSALLVSPSPDGADRVEARAALELRHPLHLVFLLGCETSRLEGRPQDYSEEAMGLQRAFLAGGARHTLGALWPVLDRDAEDFARALFEKGAALDPVTAVGAAQRCLATGHCQGRGIASWGSFVIDAR